MADKFIDIEKIIAGKNPRLLKWLPGFLLRYIKRILHEQDINAFMAQCGHLRNFEFLEAVIKEFGLRIEVKGLVNVPATGGVILAANHPLGGMDGIAWMHALSELRKDQQCLVNDIILSLGTMNDILVPVNKHGSQDAIEKIAAAYSSDQAVLIFPAGLVSRMQSGVIRDLDWKKSFITKAIQQNKPIVPVYIEAANSKFFYKLEIWRKRLGIKANIGMFYLVDEMYRQRGKTITVIFGSPISAETFNRSATPQVWAARMKEQVYALGSNTTGPFNSANATS
jgi:putative hemolysin